MVPPSLDMLKRDIRYKTIEKYEDQESKGLKDPWDKLRNPLTIPAGAKNRMLEYIDSLDRSNPGHVDTIYRLLKGFIQKTHIDKINSIFSSLLKKKNKAGPALLPACRGRKGRRAV